MRLLPVSFSRATKTTKPVTAVINGDELDYVIVGYDAWLVVVGLEDHKNCDLEMFCRALSYGSKAILFRIVKLKVCLSSCKTNR